MFCITRTGLFAIIMTTNFKVHMVSHDCNVKSRLQVVFTLCLLLQSLLRNFVTDLQKPLLDFFFFFCQFVTMQLISFRSVFARVPVMVFFLHVFRIKYFIWQALCFSSSTYVPNICNGCRAEGVIFGIPRL